MSEQLSDFGKDIVVDCEKDKLTLFETTTLVNKFCNAQHTMKEIGKYMRKLRYQKGKQTLSKTTNNYHQSIPYINYLVNYHQLQTPKNKNKKNKKTVTGVRC